MKAIITTQTQSTGIPGRYILSGAGKHMVVDASAHTGGSDESFVAQELLVGSLGTCAQAVIFAVGQRDNIHPTNVIVETTSERDPEAMPPVYDEIRMNFTYEGVTQEVAQQLTNYFTMLCPIYYTVSQGTTIKVNVNVV